MAYYLLMAAFYYTIRSLPISMLMYDSFLHQHHPKPSQTFIWWWFFDKFERVEIILRWSCKLSDGKNRKKNSLFPLDLSLFLSYLPFEKRVYCIPSNATLTVQCVLISNDIAGGIAKYKYIRSGWFDPTKKKKLHSLPIRYIGLDHFYSCLGFFLFSFLAHR